MQVKPTMARSGAQAAVAPLMVLLFSACGASAVPDPKQAATQYAEAVQGRDETKLYNLLDAEARRALGPERVEELLQQSQSELERRALEFAGDDAEVKAQAQLQFSNGEVVSLQLEDGRFRVSSASAFPSGATTPTQALHELRSALARRSYLGLLHVLSSETRAAVEDQVQDLVTILEHPEALEVTISGDRATVVTPRGHRVELKNENGVWKVRDFE